MECAGTKNNSIDGSESKCDKNDANNDENINDSTCKCQVDPSLGINRFPVTDQDIENVEDAIEREFNALSINEREKAIFDIHGITQVVDYYDPLNVNALLQQLDDELNTIHRNREAYDLAKVREGGQEMSCFVDGKCELLLIRSISFPFF